MKKTAVFDYDQKIFSGFTQNSAYPMGPRASDTMREDPRHMLFSLARYKFCAKMLEGKDKVLEVGCGDAFGAPLVLQTVQSLHCVDIEPQVIEYNIQNNQWGDTLSFACLSMTEESPQGLYDAAFSMDVIEHIAPEKESAFLQNITKCLTDDAICIIGTPNITADAYASQISRDGHINLKDHKTLKASLSEFFQHVFIFSMNDEVVHTGYSPMAHFLLALCVNKR